MRKRSAPATLYLIYQYVISVGKRSVRATLYRIYQCVLQSGNPQRVPLYILLTNVYYSGKTPSACHFICIYQCVMCQHTWNDRREIQDRRPVLPRQEAMARDAILHTTCRSDRCLYRPTSCCLCSVGLCYSPRVWQFLKIYPIDI